jgi:cation diffusion facilitator family transporter
MLSETYHSVSDTGNQVFLLIGIKYSGKDATRDHPFGYGKAQFFYSFLVSVLLFGIAGWESAKHGYHAIMNPHMPEVTDPTLFGMTFPAVWVNYSVLIGAIAFEAYALKKAYANMSRQIEENEWSGLKEAFHKTSDVTVLTALTEDAIAMAGAGIALAGVYLTRVTQNPIYDAVGALLIGFLLMFFALALAWENKRLLLGESMPKGEERRLEDAIRADDAVRDVIDLRTVYFGPDDLLVTADVAFQPDIDSAGIDEAVARIETTLRETNDAVGRVYIEPDTRG